MLAFGKRHEVSRLTSAAQDKLGNPHHLLPPLRNSSNLFKWKAHLTVPFGAGKAGSHFPWPHSSFHPHSLLLPPEEGSTAIRHSNHWKWPVQDNWKGIWAITGILISDSSRKDLNSFFACPLGSDVWQEMSLKGSGAGHRTRLAASCSADLNSVFAEIWYTCLLLKPFSLRKVTSKARSYQTYF